MSRPNQLGDFFSALAGAAATLGVVGGVGVFGYQVYVWLRASVWIPYSAITALKWLNVPWAFSPADWTGLHKALDSTPLSVAVFLAGLVVAVAAIVFAQVVSGED